MEEFELIKLEADEKMEDAVKNYQQQLNKIIVGRANPGILSSVKVNVYNTLTPLLEIANVKVVDGTQLFIKPYDLTAIKAIVAAISKSDLDLNATDNGDYIRINIPATTYEKRLNLTKKVKEITESFKVEIRQARQNANKHIKALKAAKDTEKDFLDQIQELTNKFIDQIQERFAIKEKELLKL